MHQDLYVAEAEVTKTAFAANSSFYVCGIVLQGLGFLRIPSEKRRLFVGPGVLSSSVQKGTSLLACF
jgi:hypothetical protein